MSRKASLEKESREVGPCGWRPSVPQGPFSGTQGGIILKLQAILHIPKSSAYAYPLAPKKFHVRLRTAKDDVEQAWLVIGNQYLWKTRERFPMEKTGSDALLGLLF